MPRGEVLYYDIEMQRRESGAVPPLLSYTTSIEERRVIRQKVLPSAAIRAPSSPGNVPNYETMSWKCERLEVEEQSMRDRAAFDSLRDAYPPPTLFDLGNIPGAKVTFILDRSTMKPDRISISPGKTAGASAGRKKLSRIAAQIALKEENLGALIDDLAAWWLPDRPLREGESWERRHREEKKTFGTVETVLKGTLKQVQSSGGRQIALLEFEGDVTLSPPEAPAESAATTRPGAKRDFKLEGTICQGNAEFDLTHGRLVNLTIRRELAFVADVESEESEKMQLKSGSSFLMKVRVTEDAPPQPIIIGGPKPPRLEEDIEGQPQTAPRTRPTTQSKAPKKVKSP